LVKNIKQQDTGVLNDGGSVYLSGIQAGGQMTVSWGGAERCTLTLPNILPADGLTNILNLPCQPVVVNNSSAASAGLTGKHTDTEKKSS
jgi:outer membrane usher protein FimD/PapC